MNTLYLRREPDDSFANRKMLEARGRTPKDAFPTLHQVVYYTDKEAKNRVAINPWASKPTKRNRHVMHNCAKYRVIWLPDWKS